MWASCISVLITQFTMLLSAVLLLLKEMTAASESPDSSIPELPMFPVTTKSPTISTTFGAVGVLQYMGYGTQIPGKTYASRYYSTPPTASTTSFGTVAVSPWTPSGTVPHETTSTLSTFIPTKQTGRIKSVRDCLQFPSIPG